MEVLLFVIVPLTAAVFQFYVSRSNAATLVKWLPFGLVGFVALITVLATFNQIRLPNTYFFDKSSFFPFPDYAYVALFSCSALCGQALGGVTGWARRNAAPEEKK